MAPTTSWLVECYWPQSSPRGVEAALADLEGDGRSAVSWVAVPDDDTLFVLVDGADAGVVEEAVRAAGLCVQRVVPSTGLHGLLTPGDHRQAKGTA